MKKGNFILGVFRKGNNANVPINIIFGSRTGCHASRRIIELEKVQKKVIKLIRGQARVLSLEEELPNIRVFS